MSGGHRAGASVLIALAMLLPACREQPARSVDDALREAGRSLREGDTDAALAKVHEAETLAPDSPRPVLVKATVLLSAGRDDAAVSAAAVAIDLAEVRRSDLLRQAEAALAEDPASEAALNLREEAGDVLELAGRAALTAVLADPDDPALGERATMVWERRLQELRRLPESHRSGSDLRRARLHLAMVNALRGNTDAAVAQLDMLGAHHPDYQLLDFWKGLIRDGRLRETLKNPATLAAE